MLLLAGCATTPTVAPPAPDPPRVDCTQGRTAQVPAWPTLWWWDGPPWAIQVLALLEEERRLRALEHQCLAQLKARRVIR